MSPSHTAANSHADPAAMHGLDFLVSLLVHAAIIVSIVALALWKSENTQEPLQRIQVNIVTPAQLNSLIHRAVREKHHVTKSKPVKTLTPPSKMPSLSKPAAKPHKSEKPYNPFAPLESKSDVTSSASSHSNNTSMANQQMKQLSQQEINRYVAMIQDAVERHWKVPVSLGHVSNPLVELRLRPDGSVVSINILESSGNASLDASLSRAIEAAAPFQLPPKQYEAFSDMKIRFVPLVNQQQ